MADRSVKVSLTASVSGYIAGMDEAARKTREMGSEVDRLTQKREGFVTLGTAAVAFGAAVAGVGIAAARTGIQYNTLQQTTRAALTTLLGSAEAANAQMDKLDEFARTSPFAKQVFIQAQQQMLGFGVAAKDVIPALDAIQNAVASMGGGNDQIAALSEILARVKSEGRLSGDALQRLGYYGIDAASIIGSQMNKTAAEIRDMAGKPGGIPVERIWDPLVNGLQAKFGGAAANVKNTFEGAVDRMKAAWRDLSSDLMRPFVDPSGGGILIDFLNWVADVMRAFQALPEPIQVTAVALVGTVGAVALLGGTAVLTAIKLAEMKRQLAAIGITGAAVRGGLSGVASFLMGPWGLALMTAIAAVTAFASAQQAAEQKAKSYADTLAEGTGEVTKATRELAKEALSQKTSEWLTFGFNSAYDSAKKLDIGLSGVTDAAIGNAEALARLKARTVGLLGDTDAVAKAAKAAGISTEEWTMHAQNLYAEVQKQNKALGEGLELVEQKTEADQAAAESTADAAAAQAEFNKALGETSAAFIDATGAYDAVVAKNREYAQSTADATATAEDSWEDYYDGFSVSVAGYLEELQRQVDAQTEWQENMVELAGRVSAETLDELGRMGPEGAPLVAALTTASDEELTKLEDLFAKKSQDAVDRFAANLAIAKDKINVFIDGLSGKTIHLNVATSYAYNSGSVGGIPTGNASGGLYSGGVKAFAQGGFASGIYGHRPGGIHKFAEAGDEAYISFLPQYRERNVGIWMEAGRRIGMSTPAGSSAAPVTVVLQPKGGIDLLKYIDVSIESADSARQMTLGAGRQVR